MESITKVSATEFEKVIPQADKVERKSLDVLLTEKESLLKGIQNNKDAITFQTAKLEEVDVEILKVRALDIKTLTEIKLEEQAVLEVAKPEPIQEVLPVEKIII